MRPSNQEENIEEHIFVKKWCVRDLSWEALHPISHCRLANWRRRSQSGICKASPFGAADRVIVREPRWFSCFFEPAVSESVPKGAA